MTDPSCLRRHESRNHHTVPSRAALCKIPTMSAKMHFIITIASTIYISFADSLTIGSAYHVHLSPFSTVEFNIQLNTSSTCTNKLRQLRGSHIVTIDITPPSVFTPSESDVTPFNSIKSSATIDLSPVRLAASNIAP
ncbi:hypothetical protein EmuJ_000052500 [Echinococcus multilocularis]|uniref:Uncharacterized protein n=1 Tax=Echinococcus multilocularis TaxID=6211 RepID=A0A087VWY4_ECHMU|nr:hypothetical protein EmuJ_000052500 [Echinococcus multilocularis]